MTTLTAVLTHVDAPLVNLQIGGLRALAPGGLFAVCHGGTRESFEHVTDPEKVFVDDPTLRGPPRSLQSYHVTFALIWQQWVASNPAIDAVYLIEYDHVLLEPGVADALAAVADRTGAGFLGKDVFRRTGTNWEHYGRFRRDPALLSQLRRLSVRADPIEMFGTLGDGMWLTRDALADYVAVDEHPPCYGELYVPTLLHHLGHRIVDVEAHSDLYEHVRHDPAYCAADVRTLAAAGAACIHPVRDLATLREVAQDAIRRASRQP